MVYHSTPLDEEHVMSKSLADLLSVPPSRPSRILPGVCLDQNLAASLQRLAAERQELDGEYEDALADFKARGEAGARKTSEKAPKPSPRIAEIEAEEDALAERMREAGGELLVRVKSPADWQRFKDENPPRENVREDGRLVNSSALRESMPQYLAEWNGVPITDEQREPLWDRMCKPDQDEAMVLVLNMYETERITAPKAKTSLSTGSESPA